MEKEDKKPPKKNIKLYTGSIVLGLNDALVEISGALVGLSFALSNTKTIGLAGSIMGLSAALSMSASEYLSSKEEEKTSPVLSAFYTGISYFCVVCFLILPYFLFSNLKLALISMVIIGIVIIAIYTYTTSKIRKSPFTKKFIEMAAISISVAIISYVFAQLLKLIM